jgi:HEAT repeat protein
VAQAMRAVFDRELGAVKTRAAAFLVRAADEDAYDHLVGLLTGVDDEPARTAARALKFSYCSGGQPTRPELVEKLLPYMRSACPATRRPVIEGLARCPHEAVVRGLVYALQDEDKDIAQRVDHLLCRHPDKVLVARLLREALDSATNEAERRRIERTLESVERALRLQGNAE